MKETILACYCMNFKSNLQKYNETKINDILCHYREKYMALNSTNALELFFCSSISLYKIYDEQSWNFSNLFESKNVTKQ